MRISIILLLVFISSHPAIAQEETLLSGKIENGGYGGPFVMFGNINGQTGVFVGGQGGWIINHTFVLGGRGYGLVNEVDVEGLENIKLEFGCGGALLEYVIASDKVFHASIQCMIGAGGVQYAVKDYTQEHDEIDYSINDAFFVLEPGVNLVLNITRHFRVSAGAAYRYVNGVEYEDLSDSDISGVSGQILFLFGVF
jgi:hypothetical protein